jgi:hypothetical protein
VEEALTRAGLELEREEAELGNSMLVSVWWWSEQGVKWLTREKPKRAVTANSQLDPLVVRYWSPEGGLVSKASLRVYSRPMVTMPVSSKGRAWFGSGKKRAQGVARRQMVE